jgi:hypothetical protein
MRAICSILSFDYLDYDVFINVRVFYRLAGYYVILSVVHHDTSLVVVLRGKPNRIFSEYTGIVHYYDYVREYNLDMRYFFPNASNIFSIGLNDSLSLSLTDHSVYAYLPVFPSLWQYRPLVTSRLPHPLHLSNYKPIGNDSYQQQLLALIHSQKVLVYGGKWHNQNINATQISYLSANRLLSQATHCYGLMYPYQRGTSLSGRMWQAPIHGCYVISEVGTNIYNVPGVIEAETFEQLFSFSIDSALNLRKQATEFWLTQTINLADSLNLTLDFTQLLRENISSRFLLFRHHIRFIWDKRILISLNHLKRSLINTLRSVP